MSQIRPPHVARPRSRHFKHTDRGHLVSDRSIAPKLINIATVLGAIDLPSTLLRVDHRSIEIKLPCLNASLRQVGLELLVRCINLLAPALGDLHGGRPMLAAGHTRQLGLGLRRKRGKKNQERDVTLEVHRADSVGGSWLEGFRLKT